MVRGYVWVCDVAAQISFAFSASKSQFQRQGHELSWDRTSHRTRGMTTANKCGEFELWIWLRMDILGRWEIISSSFNTQPRFGWGQLQPHGDVAGFLVPLICGVRCQDVPSDDEIPQIPSRHTWLTTNADFILAALHSSSPSAIHLGSPHRREL